MDECVVALRQDGYRIAAALPSPEALPLESINVKQGPLAVVFGNEHEGVHKTWLKHVDMTFTIPMCGFVESLNISVSAALTLHHLSRRARQELPESMYHLSAAVQQQLLSDWACGHLRDWPSELQKLRGEETP